MKRMAWPFIFVVVLLCSVGNTKAQPTPANQARTIFNRYMSLGRSFNPAVADLYCDTAVIRYIRISPNGKKRTIELPAAQYKGLIRSVMATAQARGDYNTYSKVTYAPEGNKVRIKATRYSALKRYSSPLSVLVGSCKGKGWAILEELGEVRQ